MPDEPIVNTPSAPVQTAAQPETPQESHAPMAGNWVTSLFESPSGQAQAAAIEQPPQTQEPTPAVAQVTVQPEVAAPADAQQTQEQPKSDEPKQETPEAKQAEPGEVVKTPEDQALYDSIAAELKAQFPNLEEWVLTRWTDDKFLAKQKIGEQSRDITKLLREVKKRTPPQRVVTEFERSLQPQVEPQAPPPNPQAQPPMQQPVAQQVPPQPQIPDHLNWRSEQDAFSAEAQAWAEYSDPDATPSQREMASRKLAQIRDLQARLTMQSILPEVERMAQQRAEALLQQQLGDVLPTIRQTAAQRQAEESHNFVIQQLESAGVENIREIVTPLSAEPLVVGTEHYDNTPLNRMLSEFPYLQKISVTHDAKGNPYPPQVAERLSRLERYRAAAELWDRFKPQTAPPPQPTGTPQPDKAAVQQAYQAGMVAATRGEADRARQGLNAGAGATQAPLTQQPAAQSLYQDWQASGPIDLSSLFRKS